MREFGQSRSARLSGVASTVVVVAAALTSATFLFAVWGVNAPGIGKTDLGIALGLAILAPLAVYASVLIALVAAMFGVCAWRLGWPVRRWLLALGLSLVPTLSVLARDTGLI